MGGSRRILRGSFSRGGGVLVLGVSKVWEDRLFWAVEWEGKRGEEIDGEGGWDGEER